jgi:hypothetical protein
LIYKQMIKLRNLGTLALLTLNSAFLPRKTLTHTRATSLLPRYFTAVE